MFGEEWGWSRGGLDGVERSGQNGNLILKAPSVPSAAAVRGRRRAVLRRPMTRTTNILVVLAVVGATGTAAASGTLFDRQPIGTLVLDAATSTTSTTAGRANAYDASEAHVLLHEADEDAMLCSGADGTTGEFSTGPTAPLASFATPRGANANAVRFSLGSRCSANAL